MVTGLMITRNESHFLKYSLPMLKQICGRVLVLDASDDGVTREYLDGCDNVTVFYEEHYRIMDLRQKRQFLLERGRELHEKYFVVIDADEIISEELRVVLQMMLPYLGDCRGFACKWWHIIGDLYTRLNEDVYQGIAFYDDGTNYHGNRRVHEDKIPGGIIMSNVGFYLIDAPLLHFGMCVKGFPEIKETYYKYLEHLDGSPTCFVNEYNIPRHSTLECYAKYPPHVTNDILNVDTKVSDYRKRLVRCIENDLETCYKLNIWYVDGLIRDCIRHVPGFKKNRIHYKVWRYPRWFIRLQMFFDRCWYFLSTKEYDQFWLLVRSQLSEVIMHIGWKIGEQNAKN